jgi:RimJ/RimL family protein N-acetyltransferase
MDWQTAPENARAQRLYDSLGAEREAAIVYSLAL